jgi:membrane protein CcdC involved in cytochrome C biogenesis
VIALGIIELLVFGIRTQMHFRSQMHGIIIALLLAAVFLSVLKARNENISASQFICVIPPLNAAAGFESLMLVWFRTSDTGITAKACLGNSI